MKKTVTEVLSLVLVAVMLFSLVPMKAEAISLTVTCKNSYSCSNGIHMIDPAPIQEVVDELQISGYEFSRKFLG